MQSHFKNESFKSYYYFLFSYYIFMFLAFLHPAALLGSITLQIHNFTETKSTSILKEVLEIIKCFLLLCF